MNLLEKIMEKTVMVPEAGCWLWIGKSGGDGYGQIYVKGRRPMVHRVMWEIENGPIPNGLLACHKCDTPSCINPAHIFLGTIADNMRDRDAKKRGATRFGESNPKAKLTWDIAGEIRKASGSYRDIGLRFGTYAEQVYKIKSGKTWKEENDPRGRG